MAEENVGGIVYTVDADTGKLVAGSRAADKSFDQLQGGMAKTDKAGKSLSASIRQANRSMSAGGSAAASFAANLRRVVTAAAALATLKKLIDVQREFDRLNAGLVTATGSAERAQMAFAALQEFAAKTPFDLAQTTEAFTKLVNFGLDPSERALASYGNTASALGKDLSQLVEAVADATTGEFERLKEFGIKAGKEGDKLALTFRGTTTRIGNNAREIEQFLIALGENEFAGNMAARAATLDGAISNLGDTWDGLFRTVSQAGVGDLIRDAVILATEALDELTAEIASGALQAEIVALADKFAGWGEDVQQTAEILADIFGGEMDTVVASGESAVGFLIDAFRNLPENVRALIQLMTVEVLAGFDKAQAYAVAFRDGIAAIFSDETFEGVGAALDAELRRISEVRQSSVDDILTERDAALDSYAQQHKAARALREEFDKGQAAGGGGDRLAQFRIPGTGGATSSGGAEAAKKGADEQRKGLEANAKAVAKLREELLQASLAGETLAQRQAEVALNQYATPEQIAQVRQMAAELFKLEQARAGREKFGTDVAGAIKGEVDPLSGGAFDEQAARYEAERVAEEERYAAQLERLKQAKTLELEVIGGYQVLEQQLAQQHADRLAQIETAKNQQMLQSGQQLFGELASAAQTFAGEQSGIYKALFAASKAFALADAAVKIQQGIAGAAALPFPANIPAIASVIAATSGILSAISGTSFSGRLHGGPTQAGQAYRVNENGAPELFQAANGQQFMIPNTRGEVVSNADAAAGAGGSAVKVTVNLIENTQRAGQVEQQRTGDTEEINLFVADIQGGGPRSRTLETTYGLQRQGR